MRKVSPKLRSQDQTLLQKRLQMIKKQLYGASESKQSTDYSLRSTAKDKADSTATNLASSFTGSFTFKRHDTPTEAVRKYVSTLDLDYLKKDLRKILALSTLAISTQVGLFLLSRSSILKF